MVRHESGEALSNYGREENIKVLSKFIDNPVEEVRDTCRLGVEKLRSFE